MEKGKLFLSAILAGVMIAIGGVVFLSCESKVVGAGLFAVGLFTVCVYGLALFTGKVGYFIGNPAKASYAVSLAIIWCGNAVGCMLTGAAVRFARPQLLERAAQMCAAKLEQNPVQTILLGMACGLLMYIAVDHFRKSTGAGRYFGIFLCVPTFILSGLEHCIADWFYFSVGVTMQTLLPSILFLLLATLGNACGSFLLPLAGQVNTTAVQK